MNNFSQYGQFEMDKVCYQCYKEQCYFVIKQMELLNDPDVSAKKAQQDSPSKSTPFRSEEDYKKDIINLEIQNEKYRNELYELGEKVNKMLDKVKVSTSVNSSTTSEKVPQLQQQLQVMRKQLHNVNQFVDIYQKELAVMTAKKKKDEGQTMKSTEQILQQKSQELQQIRKQVKEFTHKNKALEYKLLEYSKKGKAKSADQQALQLRQLLNQNKNLKNKLQQLQKLHGRRQKWLQQNLASAKQLQAKVIQRQGSIPKLPRIQAAHKVSVQKQSRLSQSSLPKLQSEKKIYTKWLQTVVAKKSIASDPIDKELQQLERINSLMQTKIANASVQLKSIQQQIDKLKEKIGEYDDKVEGVEGKKIINNNADNKNSNNTLNNKEEITTLPTPLIKNKKKHVATMVTRKLRKLRKDWVGKFDGMRFSDNRYVREQSRLYKVMFNTNGYCQFFYYSCRDNKQRFNSKLPFDTSHLVNQGRDSSFTVQYPDFVKNIRLKINLKTHKVTALTVVSNLGIEGEFMVDNNMGSKTEKKAITSSKQDQSSPEANYEMDIKGNQAITCVFGSYGYKLDEKKQIVNIWLEGLGVEIIEDFVQELI